MIMKINLFIKLIAFSLSLFAIHYIAANYLLLKYNIPGIYKIHVFLGLITIAIIFLIQKITKVDPSNFAKGFMVAVVLKMLSAIIFLWPVIRTPSPHQKIYIIHFFIIFFIYLFVEVKVLISAIKR